MKLWLDAQLSPSLSAWLQQSFAVDEVKHVVELGLLSAADEDIFQAAREAGATIASKDRDFIDLLDRLGPPPQVLWISCGNLTTPMLRRILIDTLPAALELLEAGEPLAEVSDKHQS
jgi:predicted nuclease of predicted toxin-antitoxin system